MQATLDNFENKAGGYDPCLWGGCKDCHARHYQDAGIIHCKEANYHGPPKADRQCRTWKPEDPLIFWPPLAPNYVTPKKWRRWPEHGLDEEEYEDGCGG